MPMALLGVWRRLFSSVNTTRIEEAKTETPITTEPFPAPAPVQPLKRIPYSRRLNRIIRVGHTKPAPSFGAPALVWHLGMWPTEKDDPIGRLRPSDFESLSPNSKFEELSLQEQRQLLKDNYEKKL